MTPSPGDARHGVTVVIPAHDEARTIGRLLDSLTDGSAAGAGARLIVVANGCSDDTADVVSAHGGAELIVLTEGSKQKAMRAGAAAARAFPIVYVDADVVLSGRSLAALVSALAAPGVEAAAPERHLDLSRSSQVVRSYYALWSALPQVRSGLFGRGVIALSETGQRRVEDLPMFMSDDLALSESFTPDERRIVREATVTIVGPRRVADLVRRRQRIITGNDEFDAAAAGRERTTVPVLLALLRRRPALAPHLPAFLAVTLAARLAQSTRPRHRRTEWLRDESSRAD